MYASAHLHAVDGAAIIEDGDRFVDIGHVGFEIAPGDEDDIRVSNMHPWGSEWLVFSDGSSSATALGVAQLPSLAGDFFQNLRYAQTLTRNAGARGGSGALEQAGGKVRSRDCVDDVLLRKRA